MVLPTWFGKAIGIALESRRLDIIKRIYEQTKDVSLLSYAMEAVIDTQFSLSYRDLVLQFLYPLFPPPENRSPHIHALTRLLVALSSSTTTVPLLVSLVPRKKLLAYQFAFDLVEGGPQDFLEAIKTELPEGDDEVRLDWVYTYIIMLTWCCRRAKQSLSKSKRYWKERPVSACSRNSSGGTIKQTCSSSKPPRFATHFPSWLNPEVGLYF